MSFQSEVLLHIAERLFIVSAPWQTWIMKIREVYLWRDPWFTAKWLVGYVFLIKVGLVVPSLVSLANACACADLTQRRNRSATSFTLSSRVSTLQII